MIPGDTIQYSGSNKNYPLIGGEIFIIREIIDYDEMTSMVSIENFLTKKCWGINYIELNKHFNKITQKELRNEKINSILDNE